MEAVRQYKWKDYINLVRMRWEGEYRYALEHDGQHDAAELLGALLHEHASRFGVELCKAKDTPAFFQNLFGKGSATIF